MVMFGRSRACTGCGSCLFLLFTLFKYVNADEYGVPVEIKLWDSQRSPLSHMVDVTNEFGLKILAEHNFLNDNNIAFSPYGLMGILVALYEGVDGESSYQLQRSLQLPWNRNVMRIGFRDIHRTLKTYFVPEEGFLAGLALNNENVTFNDNYKKILRFYGFDLESDRSNSSSSSNSTNETTVLPTTSTQTTVMSSVTNSESESLTETTTSKKEETTANPNAEGVDVRGKEETTTSSITSLSPSSMTSGQIASTRSEAPTTTPLDTTLTTGAVTTTVTPLTNPVVSTTAAVLTTETPLSNAAILTTATDSTIAADSINTVTPTNLVFLTDAADSTNAPPITNTATPTNIDSLTAGANFAAPITNTAAPINMPASTSQEISSTVQISAQSTDTSLSTQINEERATSTTTSNVQETTTIASSTQSTDAESAVIETQSTSAMSSLETTTTTSQSETTDENSQRKKRSIVDFIFTNPPYVEDYLIYRSFDIGSPEPENLVDPDKLFLVNGLRNIEVKYMKYDSMMEHAFLPHLEASALRLPLDSDRYYLLVVLPMRRGPGELERLLNRMARESDLSDIYAALRPRRVRAAVPSFTVKGHVTLTTDLQKLGVRDVFEPRQRDFTPMTQQVGVYIRSIEQAVSVTIRKYQPDDLKSGYLASPVYFAATYPFLYFVMDSNIHVALMAGKMVDPLNTRIL